jgi:hypothetical protein
VISAVKKLRYFPDVDCGVAILELAAGDSLDISETRPSEQTDGVTWTVAGKMEAPTQVHVIEGIAALISEGGAIIATPDIMDFRFGMHSMGATELRAITDMKYVCFSARTNEAFQMYKFDSRSVDAPVNISSADGLFVCITGGEADIDGTAYLVGDRYDLTSTVVVLTPVGTERCQYILVSDRSQVAPVTATPRSVSPRQIRQALTQVGLRASVEGAVAAGSQDLKDWWEFATLFERNNPQVVGMGDALGQTPEQMDALFALAASL